MNIGNIGSIELQMLWLSLGLGLVQIVLVVISSGLSGRTGWAIGPRDEAGPPFGKIGARLDRALKNFIETFVLFATAVLLANALGRHTAMSALGAQLFFWSRVAYVPAYAAGIPVLRTLIWTVGFVGIVLIFLAIHS